MSYVSSYVGEGVVSGVDGRSIDSAPLGVGGAAGSLGWGAGTAGEQPPPAPLGFDPTGGIPVLEAPVLERMQSRSLLKKGVPPRLNLTPQPRATRKRKRNCHRHGPR